VIEESDRVVLAARARTLAREAPAEDQRERISVVPFMLGGSSYAIEILLVREVVDSGSIAPVPGAPPEFLGVTTYRGGMLGVIDLRVALGLASRPARARHLLILGDGDAELGLLADAVDGPADILVGELLPSTRSHRLVRGVTRDSRLVLAGRDLLAGIGPTASRSPLR
jgi:purine-binding chemotaxis protein CheW